MRMIKKVSMMLTTLAATVLFGCSVSAAPTGLKQVKDATTAIGIDWNDSAGYSDYAVWVSTSKTEWTENTYVKGGYITGSECYVDGFQAGKSYYVKIAEAVYNSETGEGSIAGTWSEPIEVVTTPSDMAFAGNKTLKQTAAKKKSITVAWPAVTGATGYEVKVSRNNIETDAKVLANVATTSIKINTTKPTYVAVSYFRRSSTGYVAKCVYGQDAYRFAFKPMPGKAKAPKVKGENIVGGVNVGFKSVKNVDGYQVQYCKFNGKGKKKVFTTQAECSLSGLNKAVFYKVRVRGYVQLSSGKKVCGKWSKYTIFCMDQTQRNATAESVASYTRKARLKWKKVKGATSYTIYMSAGQSSGYKVITTTKNLSIVLSSFKGSGFVKHKNYYWYVVANRKVGKKTYKSIHTLKRYFYFY